MKRRVNGILLLDKSKGVTSNRALQQVKHLFQAKKAGHTGSLDPVATGMLPLCFGEATKFSQYLLDSDKTYQVTAKLGEQTTTGDTEGDVIISNPVPELTPEALAAVLESFLGDIDQVPPMFSAIKYEGKPLYEYARKGIEIERKSRRIHIFSIQFNGYHNHELEFTVHCSKGTYVRTLVEDIGKQLGCGAHVVELRRTSVTPYQNTKMFTFDELATIFDDGGLSALDELLLPVETSVNVFPMVTLSTSAAFYLKQGQPVRATFPLDSSLVRLHSDDARFLGMGMVTEDGRVKPHRLVAG